MRDIAFTAFIFGMVPMILKRPVIGLLLFVWISLMTPHRYTWGFANDFPFAAVVAIAVLVGLLVTKDKLSYETSPVPVLLLVLPMWMGVTTLLALEPEGARFRYGEVLKVLLFVHVAALVMQSRRHIDWLVWVMVASIGLFGVKGGLFTIVNAGEHRVYGPPGQSFLSDNNAIAIALVMTIPLMQYLRSVATSPWIRHALLASMVLSGIAVIGTYSRGALLAVGAMLLLLWFKSRHKLLLACAFVVVVPLSIGVMPEQWTARMNSISEYEQDSSAMGRLNVWKTAVNIANDRPLVGAGFEFYTPRVFARYSPDPDDLHSAHSVYFQMLGEHGYVGLLLLLSIYVGAWFVGRQVIAASRHSAEHAWAGALARAIQVSMVGYAVGGLFVNISYWEMPYYGVVILLLARRLVLQPQGRAGSRAGDGAPLMQQTQPHHAVDSAARAASGRGLSC